MSTRSVRCSGDQGARPCIRCRCAGPRQAEQARAAPGTASDVLRNLLGATDAAERGTPAESH